MEEVVQSIVAVGGFGYLNYWLFARMRDRDLGGETDKKFIIGLMSSLDYLIYLVIRHFCNNMILSIIFAIAFALLLTILFSELLDKAYHFSNWLRSKKGLSKQVDMSLWDMMFQSDMNYCFIFNLNGELISSGYMASQSGIFEEKSLILYPFFESHEEYTIKTETELYHYLENKELESRVYINFEKSLKIIYFSLEDE